MLSVGTSMFEGGLEMELLSPFPAGSLLCLAAVSNDRDGCREGRSAVLPSPV